MTTGPSTLFSVLPWSPVLGVPGGGGAPAAATHVSGAEQTVLYLQWLNALGISYLIVLYV